MNEIEKMKEWAENIPMEELFSEIRRLTGLPDLKFTTKVKELRGMVIIDFESQDLVDKVGFLNLIFKEIKIERFDSRVQIKQSDDDNEDSGGYWYWGTASFRYTHPGGGSNGCTFLTFQYDDRKGWEFY